MTTPPLVCETGRKKRGVFSGFSLIEMLVVIGCMAVLVAVLFPAAQSVLQVGKKAACIHALRQLYTGARAFSVDNQNEIPWNVHYQKGDSWKFWIYVASEYGGAMNGTNLGTITCPASPYSMVYGRGKNVVPFGVQNANYGMNDNLRFTAYEREDGTREIETDKTRLGRPPRFTDVKDQPKTVLFFDSGQYVMAQSDAKSPSSAWRWIPGYSKNSGKSFYTAVPAVNVDADKGRHGRTINYVHMDGSIGTTSAEQFVNDTNYWNVKLVE